MTYRSLFVEEHPNKVSATTPHDRMVGRNAPVFCWLDPYTWPTSALRFAEERDLHIDYVDNCWLLVAMDAETLREFLNTGRDKDPNVPSILERVTDGSWYVINDEEF